MKFRLDSGKQTFVIKDVAIDGFNIQYKLIADDVNTSPNGVDLTKVRVKAILYQAGERFELINTEVAPLHADYYIANDSIDLGTGISATGVCAFTNNQTVAHTASVKGQREGLTPIRFSGGIVLKGSDKIEFELDLQTGAFDGNCDADSYVVLEPNEVVTNQLTVPTIEVYPISSNEAQWVKNLGDNISTVSVYSIDKGDTITESVVTNVQFNSDKLKYDRGYSELLASRNSVKENLSGYNALLLARGSDFDNVEISMDLESSNVTAGMSTVIVRRFEVDEDVVRTGTHRAMKHQTKNRSKFSFKSYR